MFDLHNKEFVFIGHHSLATMFSLGGQENIKDACLVQKKFVHKKSSSRVPKVFAAIIEHPTIMDIEPMFHEQAHVSLLMF